MALKIDLILEDVPFTIKETKENYIFSLKLKNIKKIIESSDKIILYMT